MTQPDESLIDKVAIKLGEPPSYAGEGVRGSVLTVAALSYGSKPTGDEDTQPTGFDPDAAALFEAVVEAAYLVANADGEFDDAERHAFQHVVLSACQDSVAEAQIAALIADLEEQVQEDGVDKRVKMVARTISRPEHAREVLRVAALIAHVSGGVSQSERDVLEKLAQAFQLDAEALERALGDAERALNG
jgi:tellurite resistance protein